MTGLPEIVRRYLYPVTMPLSALPNEDSMTLRVRLQKHGVY